MVALQIRDVPDDVRRALSDRAAARGQSLQSYLLALVTAEARRSTNLAALERFADRQDGSQLSRAEAIEAADHARVEREAQRDEAANAP
ncbi:FitA-like ribbon-helix-helix domain-containing protein [Pseudactinotalea sp. Z1748]|uniref:FitA-like ribbon-helix-helix domain-containing protein n=1 Tax=Pseudactinotalea sp. Z1748 TaxID=3413027 RepID=UPI003C79DA5C